MRLIETIKVDELPKNCLECEFNQTKYCSAKMSMGSSNAFVQNNRETIDEDCPLEVYKIDF